MFTPSATRRFHIPVTFREITPEAHEQCQQQPSDQWTSINPQLTVTPMAFQSWLYSSQEEDPIVINNSGQKAAEPEGINNDPERGPQQTSQLVSQPLSIQNDDEDLEYDFNLSTIKGRVGDLMEKLRKAKTQETNSRGGSSFQNSQNEAKISVIRALLDWVPSIHLVALAIEHSGSLENAHSCLMYAAEVINALDSLGNIYDLEDIKYGVSVQLRTKKNKVIKEWRNVVGYQPYGILVWIWRDLCLSILLNDDPDSGQDSGGALVSRLLNDIRSCVPLETYDFREKKHILSFWDLFLTGGLLANRKEQKKAADPAYWSGSFIKAKMRLDQLYCANRLSELQMNPSVDLYSTVKSIFPEKYKKEPLETVKNGCGPLTIDGQIDIFAFEHCITSLERLIKNSLLNRSSKRCRDILISFSALKNEEAEWARKQVLIGFGEEARGFLKELLRIFPSVYAAYSGLNKAKGLGEDTWSLFLEKASEGYTSGHGGDEDGEVSQIKLNYGYIFRAYSQLGLRWNGGPSRERLLREMKTTFLSKVKIIFELDGWIGKTLMKGCKTQDTQNLKTALHFLVGDFGFEKILNIKKAANENRSDKAGKNTKKKTAMKIGRGIAIAKVNRARHL